MLTSNSVFGDLCPQDLLDSETMINPLVSVIIPTFNREALIPRAVESVWQQNYRPIELIVVDDGSEDNTAEVIHSYSQLWKSDNSFFVKYIHQKNQGLPSARNTGISNSNGDFIQFLDSDDKIYPEKISHSINFLSENNQVDVVVSQIRFVVQREKERFINNKYPKISQDKDSLDFIFFHDIAPHSTLIRREAIIRVGGFRENLTSAEDVDFHIRLALTGSKFAILDEVLADWYLHQGVRMTNTVSIVDRRNKMYLNNFYSYLLSIANQSGNDEQRIRKLIRQRLIWLGRRALSLRDLRSARIFFEIGRSFSPDSGIARFLPWDNSMFLIISTVPFFGVRIFKRIYSNFSLHSFKKS